MHACSVMYCVDCNLPGSSVHCRSQAETWEWVATPSSALGRSGWSQDLGCSGSSGEGWVGLEVWLCPLAAPSWDPSPRHQGGLDGSCPGDRGWGRAKGQGSPGKGNGWACLWNTADAANQKSPSGLLPPFRKRREQQGGMQGTPEGRREAEGAGREQGTAGLGVGPAGPSPPGQLPTASSALHLGSTVPPRVVLRLRLGLSQAERCGEWAGG